MSVRSIIPEVTLIGECAMMHNFLNWPKGGKVSDLFDASRWYITKILSQSDVYVVCDRYKYYSIKSDTKQERLSQFGRSHNLSVSSPFLARYSHKRNRFQTAVICHDDTKIAVLNQIQDTKDYSKEGEGIDLWIVICTCYIRLWHNLKLSFCSQVESYWGYLKHTDFRE